MQIIPDQLRSKNLLPFKKRYGGYKIPGMKPENQVLVDRVDPDLSPEEQSYVGHYLAYADALIRSAEENASSEPSEAHLQDSDPFNTATSTKQRQQPSAKTASRLDKSSPAEEDPSARVA
ncbi:MAG TPA: hypothetical protein VN658_08555 [Candidatus Acidoferrales bacterium]|nr:hypothetical protein [Candidatus Acidoferrales bacterium]